MHGGIGNECEFECVVGLESVVVPFYTWRCFVENRERKEKNMENQIDLVDWSH